MEVKFNRKKIKKEHLRWDEEDVSQAVVNSGGGDGFDSGTKETSRKYKRRSNEFENQSSFRKLNFGLAKKLALKNKKSGLKFVEDKRHITIGWHQAGRVTEAVKKILEQSLSQFRQQLRAVPLAIGQIKVPKNAEIIGSQSCMHLDVSAEMIVFQPQLGRTYKCIVTSVGNNYLTAKIFGAITFIAPLKDVFERPPIGSKVDIEFSELSVRGKICQMKGFLSTRS